MQRKTIEDYFAFFKQFHWKLFLESSLEDVMNLSSVEGFIEVFGEALKLKHRVVVA
jgi:hypothetical protein